MSFSFSDIAEALERAHRVDVDRRSAFRARLKHYQKQGWPDGLNTGRGRAATYNVGHIIQLVLALELNELGLSPERASAVLDANRKRWALATKNLAGCALSNVPHNQFIVLDPSALDDLRPIGDPYNSSTTFHYFGTDTLLQAVDSWRNKPITRYAVINITAAFNPIIAHIAGFSNEREFWRNVGDWSDAVLDGNP